MARLDQSIEAFLPCMCVVFSCCCASIAVGVVMSLVVGGFGSWDLATYRSNSMRRIIIIIDQNLQLHTQSSTNAQHRPGAPRNGPLPWLLLLGSATHRTPSTSTITRAPMPAAAPHHTHPPRPRSRRRSPLVLVVFTTILAGAAASTQTTPQQRIPRAVVGGFVRPAAAAAAAAAARPWQASHTGSTPEAGRGGTVLVWAR